LNFKTKKTHEVSNQTFKLKSQMFASSKKQSFNHELQIVNVVSKNALEVLG
jgi:hypothetical protein